MDAQIKPLVEKTWKKFQQADASKRYLIAVAGIPGSGKTHVAASIATYFNELYHQTVQQKWPSSSNHRTASQPDIALAVPLDGFHLTRKQLSEMPNAEEAIYRRGAAFTFNPAGYLRLVQQLSKPLEATTRTVYAPSFDHATKDPVENDIPIPPTARIILIEGLYTALDREIWRDANALVDETWFVDVSIDRATERVAKRNFKAGLSESYEAALKRTKASDMVNAKDVMAHKVKIDEYIKSVEDDEWKTQELKEMDEELEKDQVPANGVNGYTNGVNGHSKQTNGYTNGHANGLNGYTKQVTGYTNGHTNGYTNGHTNGYTNGYTNGHTNGYSNGYTNGTHA